MLRAAANTKADVVTVIPNGTEIYLLQAVTGESVAGGSTRWYRTSYNESDGYVYSGLVVVN